MGVRVRFVHGDLDTLAMDSSRGSIHAFRYLLDIYEVPCAGNETSSGRLGRSLDVISFPTGLPSSSSPHCWFSRSPCPRLLVLTKGHGLDFENIWG